MADYSKSCIYMIKTGNDTYIGSTCEFKKRIRHHNSHLYNDRLKDYNLKLYKTIRENNKKWEMIKLHDFPCNNDTELRIEERRVYDALQPTLNVYKPYISTEERKDFLKDYMKSYNINYKIGENRENYLISKKKYYENNKDNILNKQKERVICECGEEVSKHHISRHRKSKKHIELMG